MHLIDRFTRSDYGSLEEFLSEYSHIVPENFNFTYDIIDEYARLSPDQRAMIWVNEEGETHTFTFGEMKRCADKASNALIQMGVKKGDAVLLMLKRRYEYWFLALALIRLGCIQIPATHQLQYKDIVYRLNAASVKAVISVGEDEVLGHIRAALKESPSVTSVACLGGPKDGFLDFDRLLEESGEDVSALKRENTNDDIMLMYFTSGTTGMPKMVAQDFTYPLGHLITARFWHNLSERSIHLSVADSGWAKCGWGKIYGQWIAGATIFVYDFDKFNAEKMLKILEKFRVTSFCAPPTIYRFLIKEDLKKYDLSALEWGTVAGEPLNPEVFNRFYEATGIMIREGFGQSETTPIILTPKWMTPKPGSIGKPSPLYVVKLLGEDGREVETGEEGEVCVDFSAGKPAGLFSGYYRDAEKTDEAFRGGVYHTGDMCWRDEDGYYWFIGRADDVIKSSGYRIGPFEVESALISHPAVVECAITGVPHPDRGQIVKATVMLAKGYEPSDALVKELQAHVKHVTAPYKYPRIVEFVDELPKTVSGKIQRMKIRNDNRNC